MSVAPQDSAYDGEAVAKQAKEWIDRVNASAGPSGGWRLQVIRFRTRRRFGKPDSLLEPVPEPDPSVTDVNGDPVASLSDDSSGDPCDELPVRIRRFVPGCPWALVDQAVRYLHRIAPYRGIVYNGVRLEGAYRPTLTEWRRDEQSLSPAERGSLGTYTLIQDLVEITECPDELLAPTASSCQAYEETKFVWDADSVEELPVTCEQGVSYSIRAVRRNDDGTYDYQLVKTVSKTSSWGPVTIECTPQQETVEWGWKNLYGEPGSGLYAEPCGSGGRTLVDLPPECDERGVLTQVQLTQNQDCTFDATVRRRTSKPYEDEWTDGTSCRPETTTSYENQLSMPPVPEAAPGETVRVQMKRNQDDTYSGTVSVRAAAEPLDYSWTDGTECRERSVRVLQNQVVMPSVPQLSSLPAGSSLEASLSRSEDCLWDARYTVTAPPEPFEMEWTQGSLCRPDEVSVRQGVATAPDASEFLPREPGDTVSGSVQRNADCTYDWRKETRKAAPPIPAADRSWTQGTACRPETVTVYQNEAARPNVPAPTGGREVSASLRRNEDCTWDGQVTVREPAEPDHMQWTEGSPCRTVDAHYLVNQQSYSVPAPGEGETVSASVSRNQDCTYDVSYKVRGPASGEAVQWTAGSACRPVTHRAWFDVKNRPSFTQPALGRTVDASLRFNPDDCTWSGQEGVAESEAGSVEWTEGSSCRAVEARMQFNQRSLAVPAPGTGESVSVSVSRNADCTYDVVRKVRKPHDAQAPVQWTVGSACRTVVHKAWFDVKDMPQFSETAPGKVVDASLRFNPDDCTWSGQESVAESEAELLEWDDGTACGVSRNTKVYMNRRGGPQGAPVPSEGQVVRARSTKNADCTYDTEIVVETAREMDTGMIGWVSKETTPRGMTVWYDHGYRAFRNVKGSPPKPEGEHNWTSYSVQQNDDCTWIGHMSYRDFQRVEFADGFEGGIRENDMYSYKVARKSGGDAGPEFVYDEYKAGLITFIGTGNEGTEAIWKVKGCVELPGGARLGPRTYVKWLKVKHAGEGEWTLLGGDDSGAPV